MGLLGTKSKGRPGRVLAASGMRISTGNGDSVRALATVRQEWQTDAWRYRDMIGELRFAVQFLARAVARVKYLPAQSMPNEDEPIPLDSEDTTVAASLAKAAAEEMARLPLDAGFSFLGVFAENLEITGECWLHGYKRGGQERWDCLSVDEVIPGQDGRMAIQEYGTLQTVPVDPDTEEMLRMWVPHPRFKLLADSPMKALLSVCEEIVLAGREMRAASRSRFAANGVLLIPQGMTLLNALRADQGLADDGAFVAQLMAAMLAPINNEGDPGSVVPAVIEGAAEDLKEIRHIRFEREDSTGLLEKIEKGLARLARGLDIPPEIITGMADANHWTAWQIDASTYRHHIDPLVRLIADSLTEGFLRPALLARGFSEEDVQTIMVWYDAGNITENPNRGQDAKDAYDRGAIGMEPLRQALGFNKTDAPDDDEILRMVAFKIGLDPATSGLLLQTLFGTGDPITAESVRADQAPVDTVPEDRQLPAAPGDTPPGTPDEATPAATPAATPGLSLGAKMIVEMLTAAAAPADEDLTDGWRIDTDSGRDLMEIDRAERDRLLVAADGVLTRALEKAGAKLRSKAQKSPELRAKIYRLEPERIAQVMGREAVLALGIPEQELLGDALDGFEGKFTRWVEASIERAITVVLAMLGLDANSERGEKIATQLRDGMSSRIGSGWTMLRDRLLVLAEKYLFDPTPDVDENGELVPDLIVPPQLVRGVLAHIGGTHPDTGGVDADTGEAARHERPLGGIALGDEVASLLEQEGAQELGFEWAYGITSIRHFEPHLELNGKRFTSWADPALVPGPKFTWVGEYFQPGDHGGCMCDYVPSYALPEHSEVLHDQLATENPNATNDRILAEIDDRAGRTGTTAQRSRDDRARVLALQDRYIQGGKAA